LQDHGDAPSRKVVDAYRAWSTPLGAVQSDEPTDPTGDSVNATGDEERAAADAGAAAIAASASPANRVLAPV